jgi:hypothetical protein
MGSGVPNAALPMDSDELSLCLLRGPSPSSVLAPVVVSPSGVDACRGGVTGLSALSVVVGFGDGDVAVSTRSLIGRRRMLD